MKVLRGTLKWIIFAVIAVPIWFLVAGIIHINLNKPNYDVNQYQMHVQIQKNGNAQVTENVTYKFKDFFHGVYRTFDISGLTGMSRPQVSYTTKGRTKQIPYEVHYKDVPTYGTEYNSAIGTDVPTYSFSKELVDTPGEDNTFEFTKHGYLRRMKVYHYADDGELIRFTYRYQLKGFVTNYRDVAVVNYKLIPKNWDVPLNHVKLTIDLPKSQVKKLRGWSHGSNFAKTSVDNRQGRVTITVKQSQKGHFLETHLMFPKSLTTQNFRTSDKNMRSAVLTQERKLKLQRYLIPLGIALALMPISVIMLILARRYEHQHPGNRDQITDIPHWFELPTMAPEVAISAINGNVGNHDFSASLLNKISNHEITLNVTSGSGKKPKQQYTLKKGPNFNQMDNNLADGDGLTDQENKIFNMIFDGVEATGNDGITINDIQTYSTNHKEVGKAWRAWQAGTKRLGKRYHDQTNEKIRKNYQIAFLASLLLGILGSAILYRANNLILDIIYGVVTIALVCYTGWRAAQVKREFSVYKSEYLQEIAELIGFKHMLRDFDTFKDSWPDAVVVWEKYLAFATAFGYADKVVSAFHLEFPDADTTSSVIFSSSYDPVLFSSFNSLGSFSTFDSSSSDGGGGFGSFGGGSGGGGGGGGGGAF